MRGLGLGLGIDISHSKGKPWVPTADPNIKLWLPADAGITTVSGNVSAWADQSGNAHHTQQTTAGNRPVYNATGGSNNKPYLDFDGTNDCLDFGTPWNQVLPFTVYVVAKTEATGTRVFMDRQAAGTAPALYFALGGANAGIYWGGGVINNVASPNAWHIFRFRLTSDTGGLRLNEGTETTGSHARSALDQWVRLFKYGFADLQAFDGQFSELIYANADYTTGSSGNALIMTYLKNKYAL